ncbi:MAG: hypothetical protein AAF824_02585 [Bacteroidota bacterium]
MRNRRPAPRRKISYSTGIVTMIPVVIVVLIIAYYLHEWLG